MLIGEGGSGHFFFFFCGEALQNLEDSRDRFVSRFAGDELGDISEMSSLMALIACVCITG